MPESCQLRYRKKRRSCKKLKNKRAIATKQDHNGSENIKREFINITTNGKTIYCQKRSRYTMNIRLRMVDRKYGAVKQTNENKNLNQKTELNSRNVESPKEIAIVGSIRRRSLRYKYTTSDNISKSKRYPSLYAKSRIEEDKPKLRVIGKIIMRMIFR